MVRPCWDCWQQREKWVVSCFFSLTGYHGQNLKAPWLIWSFQTMAKLRSSPLQKVCFVFFALLRVGVSCSPKFAMKFCNVLIIVQVKPLGLSCEQRKFFFCCAHYPRFLKTDAMCLQDFVESLFFFLLKLSRTFRWFVLQQKPKQLKDSQWITRCQWELICETRKLP